MLSEQFHEQLLAEYTAAAGSVQQVERYRALHDLLRLWQLRAITRFDPSFETRLELVREAVRSGDVEGAIPIEGIVSDWLGRLRHR